ncbi:hypothetical protein OIU76_001138 [Salix suchowensis]|nr:hypothetical protein OIU76_001138 [Salix suchowensis]
MVAFPLSGFLAIPAWIGSREASVRELIELSGRALACLVGSCEGPDIWVGFDVALPGCISILEGPAISSFPRDAMERWLETWDVPAAACLSDISAWRLWRLFAEAVSCTAPSEAAQTCPFS